MSALSDLIKQIPDTSLQERIQKEVDKLSKQKKFGLVFEDYLPECTPLYDMPIKKGCTVMRKNAKEDSSIYIVMNMDNENVLGAKKENKEVQVTFALNDIVRVAEFGEPIYPYLKPIDTVCNAPDSDLWHTLIEADNYHALQLLEYLYAGKVDCIYIDPPYNKEDSKDWKYNCNYVDGNDAYRHSKWLSMMERRLKLAKKLLNPADSVLIVTIDEEEYLHLGCLLEDIFPSARIQMISSVVNPHGANRKDMFARVEEYLFFVFAGNSAVVQGQNDMLHPIKKKMARWSGLMRQGASGKRTARPKQFYPIFFDNKTGKYHSVGKALPLSMNRTEIIPPEGCFALFPINSNGEEAIWGLLPDSFEEKLKHGYVKFGPWKVGNTYRSISHLQDGMIEGIATGEVEVLGYDDEGAIITGESEKNIRPLTIWNQSSHSASEFGSSLLNKIFNNLRFPFPKSIYAVQDTIRFCVGNKPNALVLDFFAGSGTTLHAVNLLNVEDGGHRRCILITNNEVSEVEWEKMTSKGLKPGEDEWDKIGIARYVTWPRTVCSIKGTNIKGEPLKDNYISNLTIPVQKKRRIQQISFIENFSSLSLADKKKVVTLITKNVIPGKLVDEESDYLISDDNRHTASILFDESKYQEWIEELSDMDHIIDLFVFTKSKKNFGVIKKYAEDRLPTIQENEPVKIPMSDGFKANAAFFKLGFLDKTAVALGMQFKEMLPTLWMKAGAHDPCPSVDGEKLPDMLVLPENRFAVLINENAYSTFEEAVNNKPEIETVYIITDYEVNYRSMIRNLKVKYTFQLYRDYLDNFRINHGRN